MFTQCVKPYGVPGRSLGHGSNTFTPDVGERSHHVRDKGRLISFAATRNRRQVRRVRLGQQTIFGDRPHDFLTIEFGECNDPRKRHVTTLLQPHLQQLHAPRKAVEHLKNRFGGVPQHRDRIVFRLACVNHNGKIELGGDLQLCLEPAALKLPGRVIVKVVQAGLTDSHHTGIGSS